MQAPAHYEPFPSCPAPSVAELGGQSVDALTRFLARDPVANLFMLSWLDNYGVCTPGRPDLFSFRAVQHGDDLVGVSLVITQRLALLAADDGAAARTLGAWHRDKGYRLDHIVSRRRAVTPFWGEFATRPDVRPRLLRDQELYEIDRGSWLRLHEGPRVGGRVRIARPADLDAVFWASARMHTEETLEDPLTRDAAHFRRHVEHRIDNGRTYVWFDENRRLMFKADISAQSTWGAQISGVYTPVALRGRGIATAAMHDICDDLFERGFPRVTLYVNRTNAAARRVYQKVGFRYHTDYQTIFIEPT